MAGLNQIAGCSESTGPVQPEDTLTQILVDDRKASPYRLCFDQLKTVKASP